MIETVLISLFFLMALVCGAPVFAIIGGSAALLLSFVSEVSMTSLIIEMNRLANAPGIVAIPLFVFTGFLFAQSNSSSRLIKFSNDLLGWIPGGLAIVVVVVCTVFTALTGGSGITIVAVGGVLMPSLLKNGYARQFSTGMITASGSSGVLFAPSLPIIVYGMVTGTNINHLFIAAVAPGLLIVCFLAGVGMIYGARQGVPTTRFSLTALVRSTWEIKWVLPLPFLVVGGIYGGFISVSEAAAVSAVYALITECVVYREISLEKLSGIAVESMTMVGAILIILGAALGLTNFMVDQEIPQKIMALVVSNISGKIVFLLSLNLFLLAVGCLMDIFSAIVVVAPLVSVVAAEFQIDPVHLGVIFLANLEIGYLTPPVGINLFISSLRFKIPVIRLYKTVIPFLLVLAVALILISCFPRISLYFLELSGQRVPLLTI